MLLQHSLLTSVNYFACPASAPIHSSIMPEGERGRENIEVRGGLDCVGADSRVGWKSPQIYWLWLPLFLVTEATTMHVLILQPKSALNSFLSSRRKVRKTVCAGDLCVILKAPISTLHVNSSALNLSRCDKERIAVLSLSVLRALVRLWSLPYQIHLWSGQENK